ncbi:hypothetical protein KY325_02960 [Candidatus Woesearchaeota archaeon]|nr:hypothetical protein [Candidatus Woesearchaeota archaeon]
MVRCCRLGAGSLPEMGRKLSRRRLCPRQFLVNRR